MFLSVESGSFGGGSFLSIAPSVFSFLNPSVPVLIYSDMSENVQSFKRKREREREREREDKRKRKRERERESGST